MPDPASINRSLNTIRTELEFLRDSGVLQPMQFDSIMAQLPHDGKPSMYVDPRYAPQQQQGQYQQPPPYSVPPFQQIAQEAQNPQNPAHPQNPQHHQWANQLANRFGQAAVWGAGSTFGGDMVNDVLKRF